jgi:hypothetical protein
MERSHELEGLPLSIELKVLVLEHPKVVLDLLNVFAVIVQKQEILVLILELKDSFGHFFKTVGRALAYGDAPDHLLLLVLLAVGLICAQHHTRVIVGDTHCLLVELLGLAHLARGAIVRLPGSDGLYWRHPIVLQTRSVSVILLGLDGDLLFLRLPFLLFYWGSFLLCDFCSIRC